MLLPLCLLGINGCVSSGPAVPEGAFAYTGRDSTGAVVVRGWLAMDPRTPEFRGTWRLETTRDREDIGPQTGDGELTGTVRDGRVAVMLNPRFRDNNVDLSGTLEGNRIRGTWTYSTFAGPTNHGAFEAVKK
jgi:hypothetical protein